MTLRVTEESGALVFRSDRYFLELGRLRLAIPRFAEPGAMEIVHRDEGGGQFSFRLTLSHLCSADCCTSWPTSAISDSACGGADFGGGCGRTAAGLELICVPARTGHAIGAITKVAKTHCRDE